MQIHCINFPFSQAYLIVNPKGSFLIDTGIPLSTQHITRFLDKLGRKDLQLIFITHAHLDHYGNADIIRRITGAPIAIHKNDAPAMRQGKTILGKTKSVGRLVQIVMPFILSILKPPPTTADVLLHDGQSLKQFGLDATVLYTPGHTVGSSTLIVETKIAFSGDLILGTQKPHAQNYFAENWSLIPTSIQKLKAAKPEWIYPGHGNYPINGKWLQSYSPMLWHNSN